MFYYHLLDNNNELVLSNLPPELKKYFTKCKDKNKLSRFNGQKCREGKLADGTIGTAYILTTDTNEVNSSKIFQDKLALYLKFIQEIINIKNDTVNKILHEITKINGHCLLELFDIIPNDISKTKTYKKQILKVEKQIIAKTKDTAKSLFSLHRKILHIKTTCSNLKLLFSKKITVDKERHDIANAIKPSLHVYIPHLQEKGVHINVKEKNTKNINMNFEYFEAAMVPLLDNTLKYILHDSTLHIYFKNSEEGFIINFDMISMAITKEEEEDIMKYGFSGINAKKNQKNGKGIGMTTIKDSLKVNNAKIKFENNVNGRREKRYKNTTYERNIFKIIFLDQ